MNDLSSSTGTDTSVALSWHVPGRVMCLRINGDYRVEDSRQVNAAIIEELDQSQDDLVLLIDATVMNRPYHFDQIRATQTYKDHRKLKYIYIAAGDRLVKLALMIIFNLSRAHLNVCDDIDSAAKLINVHVDRFL